MEGFINKRYEEPGQSGIWFVDIEAGKKNLTGQSLERGNSEMWGASPYDVKIHMTLRSRKKP